MTASGDAEARLRSVVRVARDFGVDEVGVSRVDGADDRLARFRGAVTLVRRLDGELLRGVGVAPESPGEEAAFHAATLETKERLAAAEKGLSDLISGWGFACASAPSGVDEGSLTAAYSHKGAAIAAGLGWIGRSSLFISHRLGARVRLATLLTEWDVPAMPVEPRSRCGTCSRCVDACPSGALKGGHWRPGAPREVLIDPHGCSRFRADAGRAIGRKQSCGICMRVCPFAGARDRS